MTGYIPDGGRTASRNTGRDILFAPEHICQPGRNNIGNVRSHTLSDFAPTRFDSVQSLIKGRMRITSRSILLDLNAAWARVAPIFAKTSPAYSSAWSSISGGSIVSAHRERRRGNDNTPTVLDTASINGLPERSCFYRTEAVYAVEG